MTVTAEGGWSQLGEVSNHDSCGVMVTRDEVVTDGEVTRPMSDKGDVEDCHKSRAVVPSLSEKESDNGIVDSKPEGGASSRRRKATT